jgi:hypothetical protein
VSNPDLSNDTEMSSPVTAGLQLFAATAAALADLVAAAALVAGAGGRRSDVRLIFADLGAALA